MDRINLSFTIHPGYNIGAADAVKPLRVKAEEQTSAESTDAVQLQNKFTLETPKDSVKILASDLGYAEFPQVSPDGEQVLFNVVGDYTTSQMFIMDKDGDNLRSLFTDEPVTSKNIGTFLEKHKGKTDEQGTWSKDGETIYYRTNQEGTFGIAEFSVDSGKHSMDLHDPGMNLKHPVQVDENHVVGYGGPPGKEHATSEEFSDLFIADFNRGTYKKLTHSDGTVAYKHPSEYDGMILAHKEYKTGNRTSDIVLINPKTGTEKNLTDTPEASEKHPFYNEKRDLLAFHSDEGGDKNIWISTPDGKRRCQLTFYGNAAQSPCWSPGGKKIYFVKKLQKQADNEPFYVRQADIRVIDVKNALEELKDQAKEQYETLKKARVEPEEVAKAKDSYENYKYFLKRYK